MFEATLKELLNGISLSHANLAPMTRTIPITVRDLDLLTLQFLLRCHPFLSQLLPFNKITLYYMYCYEKNFWLKSNNLNTFLPEWVGIKKINCHAITSFLPLPPLCRDQEGNWCQHSGFFLRKSTKQFLFLYMLLLILRPLQCPLKSSLFRMWFCPNFLYFRKSSYRDLSTKNTNVYLLWFHFIDIGNHGNI